MSVSNFTEEQRAFLRCLDSCCLQAYAGTGKTSTLVGKLHILAQKAVWNNAGAICVISHTNVAVNQIKNCVAKHYPAIMEYPNFVGTIQEFVNKFLFIPYLQSSGLQIKFQDDSRFLPYKNEMDDINIVNRINKHLVKIGHGHDNAIKEFFERFSTLHLSNNKLYVTKKYKVVEFDELKTKAVSQDSIFAALSKLVVKQHEKGAFLFMESFAYGYEYLLRTPFLKSAINKRFQFVFLDEAQDCSAVQLKILSHLFEHGSHTVFQQIGDTNQSISEESWENFEPCFHLSDPMRFEGNIIDFINNFRIDIGPGLTKIDGTPTKMVLILYEANKEQEVLNKFAEILKKEKIPFTKDKGYYAIAYKHAQLSSYYDKYSEDISKGKNKKSTFRLKNDTDYLRFMTSANVTAYGAHFIWSLLFDLLYKHFKEKTNSRFKLREILRTGEKASSFRNLVTATCLDLLSNNKITKLSEIENTLNEILEENLISFTTIDGQTVPEELINSVRENTFTDSDGIRIVVGTIHSVKGQTHEATLLFSNHEYNKQDIQHCLDSTPQQTPKFKKLFYVASSRAKHLFTLAMEKSAFDSISDKSCFADFTLESI